MLTEERISKFYEDVAGLGLKHPVAAISDATGYSKGNVSQYLSRKQLPSENFITAFYQAFPESSKNVSRETPKGTVALVTEGKTEAELMRILANLSESHKNLTAAHKEIAQSNNKLAENEREILRKVPTVDAHGGTPSDELATLVGIREFVIELFADVKKTSPQEAEAVLGTKVVAAKKRVRKTGTPSGAGK